MLNGRAGISGLLILGACASLASGFAAPKGTPAPDDYVITDFETGELSTPLYGFWYVFTDRNSVAFPDTSLKGNSYLTSFDSLGNAYFDSLGYPDVRTFPPGHDTLSTRCLKFAYKFGDRKLSCGDSCSYAPYVGFGVGFSTMADTLDLATAGGIAFWAKAEKDSLVISISVATVDTATTAPDYSQRFVLDTTWKQYKIELKASAVFRQPSYGPRKPFNPSRVKSMNIVMNSGENPAHNENGLLFDDVTILGWTYVDPTSVRRTARPAMAPRLDLAWTGSLVRIRVPEAWAGKHGAVQAIDAAGRLLGQAGFGPSLQEVVLDLGNGGGRKGIRFRIVPAK